MRWKQLARSGDYLLEAYRDADKAFETYRSEQNTAALDESTRLLCGALERLMEDSEFWDALANIYTDYTQHQAVIDASLQQVETVFREEYEILSKALGDSGAASRLTSEASGSIEAIHERLVRGEPLARDIRHLHDEGQALRDAMCHPVDAERGGILRAFRVAKRAIWFVGGATIVATNAAAILAVPGAIFAPPAIGAAVTSAMLGVEEMDWARKSSTRR